MNSPLKSQKSLKLNVQTIFNRSLRYKIKGAGDNKPGVATMIWRNIVTSVQNHYSDLINEQDHTYII